MFYKKNKITTINLIELFKIISIKKEKKMRPTYNPSKIKHKRTHGFFARMSSANGQNVISRRRQKGRKKLTA